MTLGIAKYHARGFGKHYRLGVACARGAKVETLRRERDVDILGYHVRVNDHRIGRMSALIEDFVVDYAKGAEIRLDFTELKSPVNGRTGANHDVFVIERRQFLDEIASSHQNLSRRTLAAGKGLAAKLY